MDRRKLLSFIAAFLLSLAAPCLAVVPTTHYIDFGGTLGYHYSPASFTLEVGDTIIFRGDFVSFPLTSITVPSGGAAFGPISTGTTFMYIVDVPGAYTYQNKTYASLGMKGGFTG